MKNERGVAIIAVVVVVVILVGVGGILLLNRPDSENKTDQIINGNNQSKEEGVDIEKQDVLVGFSLSPKSYTEADFLTFLSKADEGDVFNLSDGQAGPELVMTLSTSYNYSPIIRVSDPQAEHILPFVTEYKPPFLGIGVEINRNRIETIDDFDDKFSSVYDQIKESSPDITVFVSFQLENMRGLDGGLFGNENNPDNNQWHLVDLFFKSDLIRFTTYPGLIYQNLSDIPVDYYRSI